ncbi:Prolyl 3-hydroxylase 2 [Liparis tanakae]|uniref:Prolyl 3-hydroxylase 2 n=1 Tax=Liparis tanakae TaxID=230148 RepID=A0A4Z2JHE8_9TELE|nr:Prolyl 3-hydroxylase 2 [Liparis tanakae]
MDGTFSPAAILSAVLLTVALSSPAASLEPYDLLYDSAVQAFYKGDYTNVVRFMEGALDSYKEVRRTKVRCRLGCQDQHPFDGTFSDLRFADVVLRRAACMNTCIEENIGTQSVHKVSEDVVQDFQRRIPYNYLQLAYQKVRGEGGSQTSTLHGALVLSTPRGMLNLAALRHFTCVSLPQLLLMRQRALGRSAAHVQTTPVAPVDSVVYF